MASFATKLSEQEKETMKGMFLNMGMVIKDKVNEEFQAQIGGSGFSLFRVLCTTG